MSTRTINFLPEIFRTTANQKFLNATLDQLVSEPNFRKLNGYIGRKFAPTFKASDNYLPEANANRQNYQLEPSVTVTDSDKNITFFSSYADLIQQIQNYGGISTDHSRLFNNEAYTFDGNVDFDKLVNFNQYYWMPTGPNVIDVYPGDVDDMRDFVFTRDPSDQAYKIAGFGNAQNPDITVARGGTYRLIVNQTGIQDDGAISPPLWIQTTPGTSGRRPNQNNVSTRDVLGVENNGASNGVITFTVPQKDDQDFFTGMPLEQVNTYVDVDGNTRGDNIDLATTLRFIDIDNRGVDELITKFNGIDGITTGLQGKYLVFVGNDISDKDWDELSIYGLAGYGSAPYDEGYVVPTEYRTGIWQIQYVDTGDGDILVNLVHVKDIPTNHKVFIKSGTQYANREYYKQELTNELIEVPVITATLDTLYYNDGVNQHYYGRIKIIEKPTYNIDIDLEIIGKKVYTSPNGVKFSNGMKIRFGSLVTPSYYANKIFYVEGVGKSIRLVDASYLITPELDFNGDTVPFDIYGFSDDFFDEILNGPRTPDYITVNRSSIDCNAWSRSNRWVHSDVIVETAKYNNTVPTFNDARRAQRPIIEFDPDLLLFNYGRVAKHNVDVVDFTVTDALNQIEGDITNLAAAYLIDTRFKDGMTVIFANDFDPIVRNKIWKVNIMFVNKAVMDEFGNPEINPDSGEPVVVTGTPRLDSMGFPVYDSRGIPVIDKFRKVHLTQVENGLIEENTIVIPKSGITVNLEPFNENLPPSLIHNPSSRRISADTGLGYIPLSGVLTDTVGLIFGNSFWFNGVSWIRSQQKFDANIPPLFDILDANLVSYGNKSVYADSDFAGCKIFSYKVGDGVKDTVLPFSLSYRNFGNMGDIEFENNYDSDSFNALEKPNTITFKINNGFIAQIIDRNIVVKNNVWVTKTEKTKQYQIISGICDGLTSHFEIDITPEVTHLVPNTKVYLNNKLLSESDYSFVDVGVRKTIRIDTDITLNDRVDIVMYSKSVSNLGYYEVPQSFDFNSLNKDFTSLTLGQFRNHLTIISSNSTEVDGFIPGASNLRDIDIKSRGGAILQHSAPAVYSSVFLLDKSVNFIDSVTLAQKEYTRFKNRFLESLSTVVDAGIINPRLAVDHIFATLNFAKSNQSPWYYSDMVPYDENKTVIEYTVLDIEATEYEIDAIFNDSIIGNKAILVYLNGQQLVKDKHYSFNQTRPSIIFHDLLNYDDVISIHIYHNTDGCYIPETPTKLGLYPKFMPERYLDTTYLEPIEVIRGHDGSITPVFGDLRDELLLELETRIYNNIKITYDPQNFDNYDYIPGKFRDTEYNRAEFNSILTRCFLDWIGNNQVDYASNHWFSNGDAWTWSYKKARDIVDGEFMPGHWRGIYKYFYDTDAPNRRPWEALGFSIMPDWWVDTYGPAPYTGGNLVLWNDLEKGVIRHGDRAGTYEKFARPGLSKIIPVTDSGELRPPSDFLISSFNGSDFSGGFEIGDVGPVENAWRRSSDYPFAMQQALALMKPGIYFGMLANIQDYYRTNEVNQYVVASNNRRITPSTFKINGSNNGTTVVERNAGYLNWIVDYITANGANPVDKIYGMLGNLQVQLAYRVAGFTDKNYLKVLAEQSSPSSTNDSVIIPDDNYTVHLHKSSPIDHLVYSAVIIEKTYAGFTVRGYNIQQPYFTIIPSEPTNDQSVISVMGATGIVYNNYQRVKMTVPYGHEFANRQQVVDFLVSYQRYLIAQGFKFDEFNQELGEIKNWVLSAKEFLTWTTQGWEPGNMLVVSPVSNMITLTYPGAVVDAVTNAPAGSKILDVGFNLIQPSIFSIVRDQSQFIMTVPDTITIGLLVVDMVQYEHALVFDNETMFKDIIYKPELGNRQYRLKLIGNKTNEWSGQLNPPGFVFSNPQLGSWVSGKDYRKGDIVIFKEYVYTALQNIDAGDTFNFSFWKQIDKNSLSSGLLPNFAYNAKKFENMYDVDNIVQDQQLSNYSNGLIGYRERNYLSDLSLSVNTQTKFYQGYIRDKGTFNAIDALTTATFSNMGGSVDFNEEWAFRIGEYGATESNQFLEVQLFDSKYIHSPVTLALTTQGDEVSEPNIISETKHSLYKKPVLFKTNIFNDRDSQSVYENDITTAGYVNINDVDATIFDMQNYALLKSLLPDMFNGYKIWAAKDVKRDWNVYRVNETSVIVKEVRYDGQQQAVFTTQIPHNMHINEIFAVRNFSDSVDGFYKVIRIDDLYSVAVTTTTELDQALQEIYATSDPILTGVLDSQGLVFKLLSMRVNDLTDINDTIPNNGWELSDTVWVDKDTAENTWAVYKKQNPWNFKTALVYDNDDDHQIDSNDRYGQQVAVSADGGIVIVTSPGARGNNIKMMVKDSDGSYTSSVGLTSIIETSPGIQEAVNLNNTFDSDLTVGQTLAMGQHTVAYSVSSITKQDMVTLLALDGAPNVIGKTILYDTSECNIVGAMIANVGSGYTAIPTATITNGGYYIDENGNTVLDSGSGLDIEVLGQFDSGSTSGVIDITLTDPGSGYTTADEMSVTINGENVSSATASIIGNRIVGNGSPISELTVTNFGTGFVTQPGITISGGGGSGATATADGIQHPEILGSVVSITLTNAGTGYTSEPTVTISNSSMVGATAATARVVGEIIPAVTSGISSITLDNPGIGYTTKPTVVIHSNDSTGQGATAEVIGNAFGGEITNVNLVFAGKHYTTKPTVQVFGNSITQANLEVTGSMIDGEYIIDGIDIIDSGLGFDTPPTLLITDGNVALTSNTVSVVTTGIDSISGTSGTIGTVINNDPSSWAPIDTEDVLYDPQMVTFNDMFVIFDGTIYGGGIRTSYDGITWTRHYVTDSATRNLGYMNFGNPIVVNGTLYVLATQSSVAHNVIPLTSNSLFLVSTTDGVIWTVTQTNLPGQIYSTTDMQHNGSMFATIQAYINPTTNLHTLNTFISVDGLLWTNVGIPPGDGLVANGNTFAIRQSDYNGGIVSQGQDLDVNYWTSLNAIEWTKHTLTILKETVSINQSITYSFAKLQVANGRYFVQVRREFSNYGVTPVTGNSTGYLYSTTDFMTWDKSPSLYSSMITTVPPLGLPQGSLSSLNDNIVFNGSTYYMIGNTTQYDGIQNTNSLSGGTFSYANILSSTNGVTWVTDQIRESTLFNTATQQSEPAVSPMEFSASLHNSSSAAAPVAAAPVALAPGSTTGWSVIACMGEKVCITGSSGNNALLKPGVLLNYSVFGSGSEGVSSNRPVTTNTIQYATGSNAFVTDDTTILPALAKATVNATGFAITDIAITATGSDYSVTPSVLIQGSGNSASATATIGDIPEYYKIHNILLTNSGSNYIHTPTVTISPPNPLDLSYGVNAEALVTTNSVPSWFELTGVTINNPGSGFIDTPAVTFDNAGTAEIEATVVWDFEITGVTIDEAGAGYTEPPVVTISPPATGNQATAEASVNAVRPFNITGVKVNSVGSGYMIPPVINVLSSDGNGSGAEIQLEISRNGFGNAIAISKDEKWLYVGSPARDLVNCYGRVNLADKFELIETITSSNGINFGFSVSTNDDGSKLVIGAPDQHDRIGGATLFVRDSTTFSMKQHLVLDNASSGSNFGYSVLLTNNGEEMLIGAPGAVDAERRSGIVIRFNNVEDDNNPRYELAQLIKKPYTSFNEKFGTLIKVDPMTNAMLISSYGANIINETKIDGISMLFDGGSTVFIDVTRGSGAVYVYELAISASTSQYMFIQQFNDSGAVSRDNFGASTAIANGVAIVGSPLYDTISKFESQYNTGRVALFANDSKTPGWVKIRQQDKKVDLSNFIRMYLYDKKSQTILTTLDNIDPAKGKILGVADQDITYKTSYDPAKYNIGVADVVSISQSYHWGPMQVGQVWWNMDLIRYMDYEQGDLTYRTANWGRMFPGATIEVLEWVESYERPSLYSGEGTPKYIDDSAYVEELQVDPDTGIIVSKYYFWVVGKESFDSKLPFRRLGTRAIADIIASPMTQGIPYAAITQNNVVSLFGVNNFIADDRTILHIDYAMLDNDNILHNEYELVQEDSADAILPVKIVNKLIDSITGADEYGNMVPDYGLKVSERYGIAIRPRQTMVIDKLAAAQNLVQFANNLFAFYPVAAEFDLSKLYLSEEVPLDWDPDFNQYVTVNDLAELSYINTDNLQVGQRILVLNDSDYAGQWSIYQYVDIDPAHTEVTLGYKLYRTQSFRTTDYWSKVDWYDYTFDPSVKPTFTVETEKDVARLQLHSGDVIWINNNGSGQFIVYRVNDDLTSSLVGIQNGTIYLDESLWAHNTSLIGFDGGNFDNVKYDLNPTIEFRNIINALKDDIFINSLNGKFNELFFMLLNYILSEQKNIDWAFKTSFVSVLHKLRKLDQYPNFIKDNQSYYEDYINEVKPYRTKIREYVVDYEGDDSGLIYSTDFDLPSYYDTDFNIWRSPNNEHARDELFLSTYPQYSDWNNHHTYEIDEVLVTASGYSYSAPPTLAVVGGGGKDAKLEAVVDFYTGQLLKVIIMNPGSGFTTTPTIVVSGDGVDSAGNQTARVYPKMRNTTVRSFDTVIKFDRVSYESKVKQWKPLTEYNYNDIVAYAGNAYRALTNTLNTETFFNPSLYELLDAASFITAADRAIAYYNPTNTMLPKDLGQLFAGIDYPGNIVDGSDIDSDKQDTIIQSYLNDMELGLRPEDINIVSHGFVDIWSSHAPEELIPGQIFDTLDIKVFTIDFDNPEDSPLGFRISKTMTDNWEFRRICADATTTLVYPLRIEDTDIFVEDVTKLPVPNTEMAYPGVIYINGEKITYYTMDKHNNSVGQLRRGTWGTGAPLVHAVGSLVVDASLNQKIPGDAMNTPWINLDTNDANNDGIIDVVTGAGLRVSTTEQALFLQACPSYLPWKPSDTFIGTQYDPNLNTTRFSDDGAGEHGITIAQIPMPQDGDPGRVRSVGTDATGNVVHGFDADEFDSYDEG